MADRSTNACPAVELVDLAEIWRRHPDQWVVLTDVERAPNGEVTAGVVHAHSPRRSEAITMSHGLRSAAIYWTGKVQGPTLWALANVHRAV